MTQSHFALELEHEVLYTLEGPVCDMSFLHGSTEFVFCICYIYLYYTLLKVQFVTRPFCIDLLVLKYKFEVLTKLHMRGHGNQVVF